MLLSHPFFLISNFQLITESYNQQDPIKKKRETDKNREPIMPN